MAQIDPLLQMSGVVKRRGDTFQMIADFDIRPGEALAIVGGSGTGKSTLLDLAALALRPSAADKFRLSGPNGIVDVSALWQSKASDQLAKIRGQRMGYIPQTGGLLPFLSVFENIVTAARLVGRFDASRAHELIKILGLSGLEARAPAELSIGQRQRVAVARALAHGPELVLADEPTASVDPPTAKVVFVLLLRAVKEQGIALLLASHDWGLVKSSGLQTIAPVLTQKGELFCSHFQRMDWQPAEAQG